MAISTALNAQGLLHLFNSLEELALSLLTQGFFIRGAIVRGPVFHDDKMIFGQGLLDAFRFENEVAPFPRVMVVKSVADDVVRYSNEKYGKHFWDVLRQAEEMLLNILREPAAWVKAQLEEIPPEQILLELCKQISRSIQKRFGEAIDEPRHFEKVKWFATYWNKTIPFGVPGIDQIKGPGVAP